MDLQEQSPESVREAEVPPSAPGARSKRAWFVLKVKPRTEKKAAKWMAFYRFFCHIPFYTKITKVQRRKVKRLLPLFPGYVFTRLYPDERLAMLKTNIVVNTIYVKQPRLMIHQLRQIKNATRRRPVHRIEHQFKAGDLVKITGGPMRGVEGIVKREGPQATLCLNVDILGVTVEVAISPEELECAARR